MHTIFARLRALDSIGQLEAEFDQCRANRTLAAAVSRYGSALLVAQERHTVVQRLLAAAQADATMGQFREALATAIAQSSTHVSYYAARFEPMGVTIDGLEARAALVAHAQLCDELPHLRAALDSAGSVVALPGTTKEEDDDDSISTTARARG